MAVAPLLCRDYAAFLPLLSLLLLLLLLFPHPVALSATASLPITRRAAAALAEERRLLPCVEWPLTLVAMHNRAAHSSTTGFLQDQRQQAQFPLSCRWHLFDGLGGQARRVAFHAPTEVAELC